MSEDAQAISTRIAALTAEINKLRSERDELLQDWALQVSPWKVDDVTAVCGYSFKGKQCQIKSVVGRLSYSHKPEVRVLATVLKKDGNAGQNTADWVWRPDSNWRERREEQP